MTDTTNRSTLIWPKKASFDVMFMDDYSFGDRPLSRSLFE